MKMSKMVGKNLTRKWIDLKKTAWKAGKGGLTVHYDKYCFKGLTDLENTLKIVIICYTVIFCYNKAVVRVKSIAFIKQQMMKKGQ